MTYANMVTMIRLILAPVIAYLFFLSTNTSIICGFLLFLVAGFTDIIDGYLARKFKCVTELGKILDPIADKAVIICCLLALSFRYALPWWVTFFYLGKELLQVMIGAVFFQYSKKVIAANFFGKAATAFFYAGITFYLFPNTRVIVWLWLFLFGIAIVLSVIAGISYALQLRKD